MGRIEYEAAAGPPRRIERGGDRVRKNSSMGASGDGAAVRVTLRRPPPTFHGSSITIRNMRPLAFSLVDTHTGGEPTRVLFADALLSGDPDDFESDDRFDDPV